MKLYLSAYYKTSTKTSKDRTLPLGTSSSKKIEIEPYLDLTEIENSNELEYCLGQIEQIERDKLIKLYKTLPDDSFINKLLADLIEATTHDLDINLPVITATRTLLEAPTQKNLEYYIAFARKLDQTNRDDKSISTFMLFIGISFLLLVLIAIPFTAPTAIGFYLLPFATGALSAREGGFGLWEAHLRKSIANKMGELAMATKSSFFYKTTEATMPEEEKQKAAVNLG